MSQDINKSRVVSSLAWKLMEGSGTQGIQFVIQLVLARLLLPEDYGIIALITVFISVANVFVQSGLNTALIQKKEVSENDFSSVFYLSLFIAFTLYIGLYLLAPSIGYFYRNETLTPVLRVLAVTLVFGAFNSIQNAIVSRQLQFKKLFFSSLGGVLGSGAVGILMAHLGLGVWALVGQQLINQLTVTMILWFTVKWRPRREFSLERLRGLFSFGWKLLVSSLLSTLYEELRSLIIGKMYNPDMLGYYNRGKQFPAFIIYNVDGSIQSVMLPAYSSQQDDVYRLKNMVRRSIMTSSFIIFPIMVGLAVVAEPLVRVILTEKWLPSVPFLQIYCASFALFPIHTANLQAINALGRSDVFLKLEIVKKVVGLAVLGLSVFYGVYAIAWGGVVSGLIGSVINAYPNKKLLDYSYKEQWKDILPSLLLSGVMGALVYSIKFLVFLPLVSLIIQVLLGIIIYLSLAWLFQVECLNYILLTCREIFRRKSGK